MGNYQFSAQTPPQPGSIVQIKTSKFTTDNELPKSVFYYGTKATVLKTKALHQSRPNLPQITVCQVKLPNGTTEVYPTANLQVISAARRR